MRGVWRSRFLAVVCGAAMAIGAAACGGGSSTTAGDAPTAVVREQKPLPEEPRIDEVDSIGTYGGRFILGQTTGPKTFNAMMANETSSTDITNNLFTQLADFDNATQTDRPALAKSWDVAPDGLTWILPSAQGGGILGRPSDHIGGRAVLVPAGVRRHAASLGAGPAPHQRQEVGRERTGR
ncbi:MAG: hypothetical protein QM736_10575 [Vicinamibacterales bacterium]